MQLQHKMQNAKLKKKKLYFSFLVFPLALRCCCCCLPTQKNKSRQLLQFYLNVEWKMSGEGFKRLPTADQSKNCKKKPAADRQKKVKNWRKKDRKLRERWKVVSFSVAHTDQLFCRTKISPRKKLPHSKRALFYELASQCQWLCVIKTN